eukprot:scaffold125771_cov19-Prasinocladus_malaysianus.AAC.1
MPLTPGSEVCAYILRIPVSYTGIKSHECYLIEGQAPPGRARLFNSAFASKSEVWEELTRVYVIHEHGSSA